MCFSLQSRYYSSLTASNLQPTANQERNDQCGNHCYSRELPIMGTVVPETCWVYKEYHKIISGLVFILQLPQWRTVQQTSNVFISLLKISSPYISLPLCHICNKILSSGILPTRLKYAVINPMFKTEGRIDKSNYRTMSLLPSFSKVFKKALYIRMWK